MSTAPSGPVGLAFKAKEIEELADVYFFRPLGYLFALLARNLGLSPSAVTVIGTLVGIGGGVMLATPSRAFGGFLVIILHSILDSSDGQLARMLRNGVRGDDRAAFPLMSYQDLSDEDVVGIVAFLKSRSPVVHAVPGHRLTLLGKTLMARTIARALEMEYRRIQFTPDLMPSDITGTDIIEEDRSTGGRQFRFVKGPVFANILLADEINRTPPKTQAALLQAMQELQVTVSGRTYELPRPFLAT